jgi:hypothetical protein
MTEFRKLMRSARRRVCDRCFVKRSADAPGAIKKEMTRIAPTASNAATVVNEVSDIKA